MTKYEPERRPDGTFAPGSSGNPAGGPKKGYSMGELLSARLAEAVEVAILDPETGAQTTALMSRKEFMTFQLVTALTEGRIPFADGRTTKLRESDWHSLYKYVEDRVDGAIVQRLDLTSGGRALNELSDDEVRAEVERRLRDGFERRALALPSGSGEAGDRAALADGVIEDAGGVATGG